MKRAVFIERDGILNEVRMGPKNPIVPLTLEEFRVKQEAEPSLRKLKKAGFVLIVTSNQPGLSRGYQSRRELDRMHDIIKRCFPIDDLMVCPHDESDHCPCRKPRPCPRLQDRLLQTRTRSSRCPLRSANRTLAR